MPTIREVKTEFRHREWAEQIQECQSSGMTVTAWCKEKGISQHTYYSRLNVVRKELLKRAELPLQQIVPLSVSQSVTCTTAAVQTQCVADSAEPGKPEPAVPQKMIVRKDGKFSWPRNEQEVRNITREQFIWLTQGLSIDQPKAIKKVAGGVDIC